MLDPVFLGLIKIFSLFIDTCSQPVYTYYSPGLFDTCTLTNSIHSTMFWPPDGHFAIIPPQRPQMIKLGLRR